MHSGMKFASEGDTKKSIISTDSIGERFPEGNPRQKHAQNSKYVNKKSQQLRTANAGLVSSTDPSTLKDAPHPGAQEAAVGALRSARARVRTNNCGERLLTPCS